MFNQRADTLYAWIPVVLIIVLSKILPYNGLNSVQKCIDHCA